MPLADAADAIAWLDVPWRVAAWRIVKRHIAADLRRTNQHSGYRRLLKFLAWSRQYYTSVPDDGLGKPHETRLGTLQLLEHYRQKVLQATP